MTGNKCLLDTSIVIHLFKNAQQASVLLADYEEVYINSTAIGELYYGAYASSNLQKHVNQIQSFLHNCNAVHITDATAIIYAQLKLELRKNGTPIPENDIWIAASSVEHSLPLFTNDSHFKFLNVRLISL